MEFKSGIKRDVLLKEGRLPQAMVCIFRTVLWGTIWMTSELSHMFSTKWTKIAIIRPCVPWDAKTQHSATELMSHRQGSLVSPAVAGFFCLWQHCQGRVLDFSFEHSGPVARLSVGQRWTQEAQGTNCTWFSSTGCCKPPRDGFVATQDLNSPSFFQSNSCTHQPCSLIMAFTTEQFAEGDEGRGIGAFAVAP